MKTPKYQDEFINIKSLDIINKDKLISLKKITEYIQSIFHDYDFASITNKKSGPILNKNYVFKPFTFNGVKFEIGDYLFSNIIMSEYIIMCEVSKFLTNTNIYCIHFTSPYSLLNIDNKYSMFMEFIHCGTLDMIGNIHLWEEFYSPELFLSIFFSIATYQTKHIVHYDLHLRNIFYIILNEKYNPMWRGKRLLDYEYFEYRIKGVFFYIKRPKIVIKISDWGLGVKYSSPKIMSWNITDYEFDTFEYQPIYDIATIIQYMELKLKKNNMYIKFISKIIPIIFDREPDILSSTNKLYEFKNSKLTAENLILNYKLFDKFKVQPISSSIIKVCNIN